MEKRRLLFISSLFSCLLLLGQEEEADSLESVRMLTPSIYIDYGKLLTIPTSVETKYEGGIELLIAEKFPLIAEIGAATLSPTGAYSNGEYESKGTYYRFGTGYMSQFNPKNMIGISFRYGMSSFDEEGRIQIESTSGVQETFVQSIKRNNLSATWWEVVIYSDMKLLRESDLLYLGMNLRLRILQDYDKQESIDVYSIPGYGRSFDSTIPAANFFIKVKF